MVAYIASDWYEVILGIKFSNSFEFLVYNCIRRSVY